MRERLTLEKFLIKANQVHGNRYDYSQTVLTKTSDNIKIICNKHGPFIQRARAHLYDMSGCPECRREKANSKKLAWTPKEEQFVLDNYKNLRCIKLANHLKCSVGCVVAKVKKLGIFTNASLNSDFHSHISWGFWNVLNKGAKTRNIKVEISPDDIWNKYIEQKGYCALSGRELLLDKNTNRTKITASVDRIDSSKDYTVDNIQIVHKYVNLAKFNKSVQEFYEMCRDVHRHLEQGLYLNICRRDTELDMSDFSGFSL